MQALSIYILLRLEEGETEYNNLDALLIATVTAIATQFNRISSDISQDTQKDSDNQKLELSWKTWIFEESARRLCLIYQVVNMLIYFEPAVMCTLNQVGLLLSPLPAKKQLWEAKDERSWKMEGDRDPGAFQIDFGLATNGDLVKVGEGIEYCDNAGASSSRSVRVRATTRTTAHWEDWCAGMDGLGGLVMLAASLVS